METLRRKFNVIIPSLFFLAGCIGILLVTLTTASGDTGDQPSASPTAPLTVEEGQEQPGAAWDGVIRVEAGI